MHNSQSVSVATAFKDGSQEVCVSAVVSVFEMTSFLPLVFASNVFLIYLPVWKLKRLLYLHVVLRVLRKFKTHSGILDC